jgi:hypothetical protein
VKYFKETSPQAGVEITSDSMKAIVRTTPIDKVMDSYDCYDTFVNSLVSDDLINLFGGNFGAINNMFEDTGLHFDREHLISYLEEDIQKDETLKSEFLLDVIDQLCETRTRDYAGGLDALKKGYDRVFGGSKVVDAVLENASDIAPVLNNYINNYEENIYYLEVVRAQAKYEPELVSLIDQIIDEYQKTFYDKMDETHIAKTIKELHKSEVRTLDANYLINNYGLKSVMSSSIISKGLGKFTNIVGKVPWVSTATKVIASQAVIEQMEQTMRDNELRLINAGDLKNYEISFNVLKEMYKKQYDNMLAFYDSLARMDDSMRIEAYKTAIEDQTFYSRKVIPTMDGGTKFSSDAGNGGGNSGGRGF